MAPDSKPPEMVWQRASRASPLPLLSLLFPNRTSTPSRLHHQGQAVTAATRNLGFWPPVGPAVPLNLLRHADRPQSRTPPGLTKAFGYQHASRSEFAAAAGRVYRRYCPDRPALWPAARRIRHLSPIRRTVNPVWSPVFWATPDRHHLFAAQKGEWRPQNWANVQVFRSSSGRVHSGERKPSA